EPDTIAAIVRDPGGFQELDEGGWGNRTPKRRASWSARTRSELGHEQLGEPPHVRALSVQLDSLRGQPPLLPRRGQEHGPVLRPPLHRNRGTVLLAAGDVPDTVRGAQAVAVLTPEAPDPDQPVGRGSGVSIEPDLRAKHRGLGGDWLICSRWFPGVFDSPE